MPNGFHFFVLGALVGAFILPRPGEAQCLWGRDAYGRPRFRWGVFSTDLEWGRPWAGMSWRDRALRVNCDLARVIAWLIPYAASLIAYGAYRIFYG